MYRMVLFSRVAKTSECKSQMQFYYTLYYSSVSKMSWYINLSVLSVCPLFVLFLVIFFSLFLTVRLF